MWVSHTITHPQSVERLDSLPTVLRSNGVELRLVDSLVPLKNMWGSSLHVSGLRLRNAAGWK